MYAQAKKSNKENKSRPVANSVAQKKSNGSQGFEFVDNRDEAVAQRKIQEIANKNSPALTQRYVKLKSEEKARQGKFDTVQKKKSKTAQLKEIIQCGGGPKPSDVQLSEAEKICTFDNFVIYHGKRKKKIYVEALIKVENKTVRAAYVEIVIKGKSITLHTFAKGEYRGKIGTAILPIAIATVANKHVKNDSTVTLPMGGAAVIKLLISKLSQILGTPEIHAKAEELREKRKEKGLSEKMHPDILSKNVAKEHKLHMESLMKSEKGQQLSFTSYGLKVVAKPKEEQFGLEDYLKKITTSPSQLWVDIPGKLFIEFAIALQKK